MVYTNSNLVTQTKLITNGHYNPRTGPIEGITIHHNAGVCTVANLLDYASTTNRTMSFNYCLRDYEVGQSVEEKYRAWTSSSRANDMRCVTIEVINSSTDGDWPISDASMETLIKLCADICLRNNIPKLYYDGTTKGTLTRHQMFNPSTDCPGAYIKAHTQYICDEVNKLITAAKETPNTPTVITPPVKPANKTYEVVTTLKGYYTAANAVNNIKPVRNVDPGVYFVYNETANAINVTKVAGVPGAWVNKALNKETVAPTTSSLIGKDVIVTGQLFGTSSGAKPGKTVTNLKTKITRYVPGAAKPYNVTGDLGWLAATSVKFVDGSVSQPVSKPNTERSPIGRTVIINGQLFGSSAGAKPGKVVKNKKTKITRYIKGAAKPYNTTGDLGWMAESSVKFID